MASPFQKKQIPKYLSKLENIAKNLEMQLPTAKIDNLDQAVSTFIKDVPDDDFLTISDSATKELIYFSLIHRTFLK